MKKICLTTVLVAVFTVTVFSQKFAFVDSQYILDNIPEYQQAQTKLDETSVEWQKEIEVKFAEIDKLYKSFQAEAVLLPEDIKIKREEEIILKEKEVKELQKKRFGTGGDLAKKREELVKPIQTKIYNAIEEIATIGNFALIFDTSSQLSILYSNAKFDKSDEVLEKLGYKK